MGAASNELELIPQENSAETASREYADFSVSLQRGSAAKKRLSNRLSIVVPGDRVSTSLNLTIRQARSLRKFLNDLDV